MTNGSPRKDPLMNLADALAEDILSMSDEEILAESTSEEIAEARKMHDRALAAALGEQGDGK